jgi:O-6-methylguanine DNA methyltransferase
VPLALIGAPFQLKVWEALLRIPSGHVTTYSEIAACHRPPQGGARRRHGGGRNPVSWLIPCHRAVRKSGGLGGYHWGLPVKRAILARETAALDATATLTARPLQTCVRPVGRFSREQFFPLRGLSRDAIGSTRQLAGNRPQTAARGQADDKQRARQNDDFQ